MKVSEGDIVRVAVRDLPTDATTLVFDKVLMIGGAAQGNGSKVGAPYLPDTKVTADVISTGRTDKVEVVKFKKRKNYLRRKGHRQDYIEVKITSIQS